MNQTGTSKEKDQPQGSVESEGWSVTSGLDSPADINQETGDILKGCHGGRMATWQITHATVKRYRAHKTYFSPFKQCTTP